MNIEAHVLLVDDTSQTQKILKKMLERIGCSVDTAENGREALDMLKDQSFDLIFMDCEMPEMDGYDTTRHIRDHADHLANPNPIVIAITGNSQRGSREQCLHAGMNDYLCKPIDFHDLQMCVERWIELAA